MPKQSIYLAYDLGVGGDYDGLYTWLDTRGAKECGDGLAFINYEYNNDLLEEIKQEISNSIDINKKTRIYVIYNQPPGKRRGSFLFGKRKSAPWLGYGAQEDNADDIE